MADVTKKVIETKIPARLDRLPWSKWHWYIIASLGTVWILDGLEVTMKGSLGPALRDDLGLTSGQVGLVASVYVAGAISGALFWGFLTDRKGRKKLFMATLGVYMLGVVLTTVSWGFLSFAVFRFITGFGIGGEYAAINSAVDELIPARARGWADLAINGSYWAGAAVAAGLSLVFLNLLPDAYGWRAGFATGAVLAVGILLLRRAVPESPRWLMTHGQEDEAEQVVREIEESVLDDIDQSSLEEPPEGSAIELRERRSVGFIELARTMFTIYPKRSAVSFALMATQAFLYNAIFFTYGLILTTFYGVGSKSVGLYILPFAVGNLLGPIVLGRFFDTVGRKPMISGCYILSGLLTAGIGYLFTQDVLTATTLTAGWVLIFFFASAGSSAGYLTVSETFPLEIRAMAIAFFYAIATGAGGIIGPWLFGSLIGDGNHRGAVFIGYLIGAGLMVIGGLFEMAWGIAAEQRGLEDVAKPLSAAEAGGEDDESAVAGRSGPLGVDPADAESIRSFQEQHDLEDDGVLGPVTQGAMHAQRETTEDLDDDDLALIDPTDRDDVRRFQRRYGVPADGVVGPVTRGALRFARVVVDIDPTRPDEVRRFQESHDLPPSGRVDEETRIAIQAVQADTSGETPVPEDLDPSSADSIARFQGSVGIDDDGTVGADTRGAILAARAHRSRWSVGAGPDEPFGALPFLDAADPASVRAFQRRYGLEATGDVDEETSAALHYEIDHHLGVDPSDPDSIGRFQRDHGLVVDGVIGDQTRGAMVAERAERELTGEDERADRYGRFADPDEQSGGLALDPTDAESVQEFQREHGLDADGVVGPRTQVALRAVGAGRRRPHPGPERHSHTYHRRPMSSGLFSGATVPEVDVDIDHEIDQIVAAVEDGAHSQGELSERLNGRQWGPGRFRRALRVAVDEGRIRKISGGRYAATDTDARV